MARKLDRLEAKRLYVEEGKDIKEIALIKDIPEQTLYRWREQDGWDKDREMMQMTGVTAYKQTLLLAVKQLTDMATSGEIDPRKADALNKVIKSAKSLAKDIDKRGNILLGMSEFVEFLRENYPDQLDNLQPYIIEFGGWVKKKYP